MKKILVIEDNSETRLRLKTLIDDLFSGFNVFTATNGSEGIWLAKNNIPDVILLSINISEMDCFEVCKRLKEDENLCDIPVIFITVQNESKENKARAIKAGAEGFLSKPFDEPELFAQISAMLKIKEAGDFRKKEKNLPEEMVFQRTNELWEELQLSREINNKISESNRRLEAFLQISRKITTKTNQSALMQEIVDHATNTIGVGSGALYLLQDENTISLAATVPALPEGFPELFRIALVKDHPHIMQVLSSDSYVLIDDCETATLTSAEQEIVTKRNLRSILYLPISLRGEIIGVLILGSTNKKYSFTEEDISLLQDFTHQVAQVNENASNFEQAKKHAEKLELEITERKQAEEKLFQEHLRFQHLFEKTPIATWLEDFSDLVQWFNQLRNQGVVDLRHFLQQNPEQLKNALNLIRMVDINQAALVQNGAPSKEQLLGNLTKLFDENTFSEFLNELDAIWQGADLYEYESQGKTLDGRPLHVIVRLAIPKYNGSLDYSRVVVTGTNITERKQMEESLRESEKKYSDVVNSMNDTVWVIDHDMSILDVNDAAVKVLGYTREELLSMKIPDIDVNLLPEQVQELALNMPNDKTQVFETSHRKKNGETIPVEISSGLVSYGGRTVILSIARDITERRRAEEERENAMNMLQTALAQSPSGILIAEAPDVTIRWVNEEALGIRGKSELPLSNIDISKHAAAWQTYHLDGTMMPSEELPLSRAVVKGEIVRNKEVIIRNASGEDRYVSANSAPIRNSSGEIIAGIVVFHDITERKKAELELKESGKKYQELSTLMRLMADNMPDLLWAKNLNSEYIFSNKAICDKLLGATDTEEPLGKTDMFFAMRQRNSQPDNPNWHTFGEICRDSDAITLQELKPMQFDEYGNVKGKFLFLDVHKAPLYNEQGQLIGVVGSARDITERKALEERLIHQTRLRELLMEISSGFINIPLDKVEEKVNEALIKMGQFVNADRSYTFDYDWAKEVCHNTYEWCNEGISTEIQNLQNIPLALMIEVVEEHKMGNTVCIPDVSEIPEGIAKELIESQGVLSFIMVPMMNADQCIGFVGFDSVREYHDYSQTEIHLLRLFAQALANVKLRQTLEGQLIHQTLLRELLMGISSGFINIPLDKVEESVNEALSKMAIFVNADRAYTFDYDWEKDECNNIFEWCKEGISPEINNLQHVPLAMMQDWVDAHKKGEPMYVPDVFALPHGAVREILEPQGIRSVLSVPMMNQHECIGFVGFDSVLQHHEYTNTEVQLLKVFAQLLANVKLRKEIVEQLIAAKEKAEESDRLKSAFLANMSHEIRTPMNGILGFADVLKLPDLTGEEQQRYIELINKSGQRMLNIINDIIDISKIEAGLMKLNLSHLVITEQLRFIQAFFKPEAEAKGLSLSIKNSLISEEVIITTDPEKLYAILSNLVKNAIKYTHSGFIEVGCLRKENFIEFYVTDSGIGIPKDRQKAIFERFIQADIEDRMAYQGAGLGLAISKSFVEMLGGEIWVESEEGTGATFYFTLPYKCEPPKLNAERQPLTANEKVEIRKLKTLVVEDDEISEAFLDTTIRQFSSEILLVRTGVDAIEKALNSPDIDLILMDIRLPDINGYETTLQIRHFNKNVIIIAQTAFGLSGDREKAIGAGCNDYIAKPFTNDELQALIQKYFVE